MNLRFLRRRRSVGLDVGSGCVKALCLERRRGEVVITGLAAVAIEAGLEPGQLTQAIHAALAAAGADRGRVVAAVGGSDVVIRQVSLPPVPSSRILPALEIQHRELGLLSPGEAVIDAQVLRRSKNGVSKEVLSVAVPRARIDERLRLLQLAAVDVQILDVEPLALLNGAIRLTALGPGELLVLLTIGRQGSVLCLFSEQGPVVARYLAAGAETFMGQLRATLDLSPDSPRELTGTLSPAQAARAEAACREVIEGMAEDIRLSLSFYRTEYDRESLPRYAISGSVDLPDMSRWIADRLGLGAPLELLDPFTAVEVKGERTDGSRGASGSQFLQAFGLALRGL
jgi:type IV pilus assembly protein PilM